jgi:PadR family transcriptional regulator, regulatory protein PadR
MKLRLSPQTLLVLDAFLEQVEEWKYGYDLSRVTGLKSGTLYPILMRLAERKLLETEWEASDPGRPPRHMYRFTPEGLRIARANVQAHAGSGLGQVALGLVQVGHMQVGQVQG